MRPKVVLTSLTFAALVVALAVWIRRGESGTASDSATDVATTESSSPAAQATVLKLRNQKGSGSQSPDKIIEAAGRHRETLLSSARDSSDHVATLDPSSPDAPTTSSRLRNQRHPEPESLSAIEAASLQRETLIMQSISAIDQAVANKEPDALSMIVEKLNDPEKEVRMDAIQGLWLLNNRDAIPFLQAAMDRSSDTEDKAEMLKAIQSLQTP